MKLIQILSFAALSAALATPPHNNTLTTREDSDLNIILYTNADCTSKQKQVFNAVWYGGQYKWTQYNGFQHYSLSRDLKAGESIDFSTVGPGLDLTKGLNALAKDNDPCVNPSAKRVQSGSNNDPRWKAGCRSVGAISGCFEVCNGCS